jgi:CBS domain-containing protein
MSSETSYPNHEAFRKAYQRIEEYLRAKYRGGNASYASIPEILDKLAPADAAVRAHRPDILTIQDLRNAIVHNRQLLADVTGEAVQLAESIADHLERPPLVDAFVRPTVTVESEANLAEAVSQMAAHDFSQLPVTREDRLENLLTANTLARWLGSQTEQDILSLKETPVAEVLQHAEDAETWRPVGRSATLFDVLEAFGRTQEKGKRLAALIITQNGKRGEKPLGIITAWDLMQVHQSLEGKKGN